jgi:hypothetical protein
MGKILEEKQLSVKGGAHEGSRTQPLLTYSQTFPDPMKDCKNDGRVGVIRSAHIRTTGAEGVVEVEESSDVASNLPTIKNRQY